MRKYAFIRDGVVRLIDFLAEEEYIIQSRSWEAIVDVEDASLQPQVGWLLIGNTLLPVSPEVQQREQQLFGASLCLEMVNRMGSRNLTLAQAGTAVNVSAVLATLGTVKSLLETGALKTARTVLQMYAPTLPLHSDLLTETVTRITAFLQSKGWD